MSDMDRFMKYVEKTEGCWLWQGGMKARGYGNFWLSGHNIGAHRASYLLFKGKVDEGLVIDHLCRKRDCVNPAHLEAVTNKENILRGEGLAAINHRKQKCVRGHKITEKRVCGICHNLRNKKYLENPEAKARQRTRNRIWMREKYRPVHA